MRARLQPDSETGTTDVPGDPRIADGRSVTHPSSSGRRSSRRRRRHQRRIKRAAIAAAVVLVGLLVGLLVTTDWSNTDSEKALTSARADLQKNDLKSAAIQAKNALQAKPDLAEARFLLGTILLKDGNASGAEIELRKALAADYPEKQVVPELAISLSMQGQDQKLVDEFGDAQLGDAAADASLQTTLAAAYGALGKPELLESALAAALKADPRHAPALLAVASARASIDGVAAGG